jgi:sarcosine oxidase subunit beta
LRSQVGARDSSPNPDNYVNRTDLDFIESAIGKLDHRFPSMPDPRITASYAGCYDVTPDYNPIIGPADVPGLFIAAGFNGHGYKISPAVGRLVADLLIDGTSSDPAIEGTDFRLARFPEGKPLVSAYPYIGAGQMR